MSERHRIRVLIVDDSAVMRKLLSTLLARDPEVEVVATAVDGSVALRKVAQLRPDVVTLDLEMPGMDGIDVLREIMHRSPVPVLIVSAHTQRGAAASVTAMEMGAVDVVAKPRLTPGTGLEAMAAELLAKVKAVAGRRWRRPPAPLSPRRAAVLHARGTARNVVAVGVSTGGPAALAYLLPRLPADLAAAVVVVQHMPEGGFTEMLARRLAQGCGLDVREARDGDALRAGQVLIAPGGRHLRVRRRAHGATALVGGGEPVSGHRPSADVLFESVASDFGSRGLGVLLTGMGEDGAAGLQAIRNAQGRTVAQDEESSVVFGMPRAAIARGAVQQVLSLEKIPAAIVAGIEELEQEHAAHVARPSPVRRSRGA
ncbi:MAG: chemotaxis response regulator protein-glutamate methylesterase [Vicinamibacteria bacterium]